jgi:predicted MPP superfamily phosphohydrolase
LVLTLFWGSLYGRFLFRTSHLEVFDAKLPKSFDGLKVVQFSDIHLGTFMGHENEVARIVEIINAQNADIVIFTGDLVNSFAEEITPFAKVLSLIKAKQAKYAVLGNHDYGDYYKWNSKLEQLNDHRKQIELYGKMGFKLLQNEHVQLVKKNDTIVVSGVENWGKKPYRQEGDLDEALSTVSDSAYVLLLSHDPTFWDEKVLKKRNVRITFSGHTHGYQLGFKVGTFEWSPLGISQKRVAGIYENEGQYLYINRGLGGALYPGRVGVFPEITVFTLKTGAN